MTSKVFLLIDMRYFRSLKVTDGVDWSCSSGHWKTWGLEKDLRKRKRASAWVSGERQRGEPKWRHSVMWLTNPDPGCTWVSLLLGAATATRHLETTPPYHRSLLTTPPKAAPSNLTSPHLIPPITPMPRPTSRIIPPLTVGLLIPSLPISSTPLCSAPSPKW